MGVDDFSQAQYLQLDIDIRNGNPSLRPSLLLKLPVPPNRYLRKKGLISGD